MQITTTVDTMKDSPVLQRIDWKLKHGDGLLGWEGDPGMWLTAAQAMDHHGNPIPDEPLLFEVWTRLEDGQVVHVVTRPYLDDRLIEDVVRADNRRFDVAELARQRNIAVAAERDRKLSDATDEAMDKLHFALLKGGGHLYAGGTRRLHTVGGTR